MNNAGFFFLFLLFVGCSEPQKHSIYDVTINYDELNLTGSGYESKTKTDTIHSINDSTAYVKALFMASARASANEAYSKTRLGEAKIYFFSISDSLGNSLGKKLGVLKIEEINQRISVVDQDIKDKFLF